VTLVYGRKFLGRYFRPLVDAYAARERRGACLVQIVRH
jgi:hypothetical protein